MTNINPIAAAIAELERGMESTGTATLHYQCMGNALAALRSIKPATEQQIADALFKPHLKPLAHEVRLFRAAERRIFG